MAYILIGSVKKEKIGIHMAGNHNEIEKHLWDAADELRANSKFTVAQKELEGRGTDRRAVGKIDYQARGVMYLPEASRFSKLLNLPEGSDIGKAINEAMRAIEIENEELKDILPKTYNHLDNSTLVELLKTFNLRAAQVVCSSRARALWETIRRIPMQRLWFMDKKRPLKLCPCAR